MDRPGFWLGSCLSVDDNVADVELGACRIGRSPFFQLWRWAIPRRNRRADGCHHREALPVARHVTPSHLLEPYLALHVHLGDVCYNHGSAESRPSQIHPNPAICVERYCASNRWIGPAKPMAAFRDPFRTAEQALCWRNSPLLECLHDLFKASFHDNVIPLFKIYRADDVFASEPSYKTHPVDIDGDRFSISSLEFHVSVHGCPYSKNTALSGTRVFR